jgi:hypothetical protein
VREALRVLELRARVAPVRAPAQGRDAEKHQTENFLKV